MAKEKQVIISIGREYGSCGHKIAEILAEKFGFHLYDHKILDEIAAAKNIKVEYLKKYDEKPRNIFLSRRVGAYSNSMEEILPYLLFSLNVQTAYQQESLP